MKDAGPTSSSSNAVGGDCARRHAAADLCDGVQRSVVLSCQIRERDPRVRPVFQLPGDTVSYEGGVLQSVELV